MHTEKSACHSRFLSIVAEPKRKSTEVAQHQLSHSKRLTSVRCSLHLSVSVGGDLGGLCGMVDVNGRFLCVFDGCV